ncbi:hypothetical protein Q5752_006960 [Cryptotrichosporon argae]
MRLALAVAVLAATTASAFRDTSPLLVWSSTPNEALADAAGEITSGVIAADGVYSALPSLGCDFDTLVVVHVDDLHHSHIEDADFLPVKRSADLHIPYLVRPARDALEQAARSWALACGAGISWIDAAQGERALLPRSLPERHLILYTGTRQERPFPSSTTLSSPSSTASTSPTLTSPGNGFEPVLDRVQILTTPVIMALLISLGVLLPILLCGISQLAGIQVPPRMLEISKSATTKEKKEQ